MSDKEIKRDLELDRIWVHNSNHEATLTEIIASHAIKRAISAESSLNLAVKALEEILERIGYGETDFFALVTDTLEQIRREQGNEPQIRSEENND